MDQEVTERQLNLDEISDLLERQPNLPKHMNEEEFENFANSLRAQIEANRSFAGRILLQERLRNVAYQLERFGLSKRWDRLIRISYML